MTKVEGKSTSTKRFHVRFEKIFPAAEGTLSLYMNVGLVEELLGALAQLEMVASFNPNSLILKERALVDQFRQELKRALDGGPT